MRLRVLDKLALQDASKEDIEKQVIENYKRLMTSFFEQKQHIPKDNFVEIRYEDLVLNPVQQVQHIYETLKISDFDKALPEMQKYLEHQSDYKTNVYTINKKIIHHVDQNWMFTIDQWRYNPPK